MEWAGQRSCECSDRCNGLNHGEVVGFVAIRAQRVRKRDGRCEFDAGKERNHNKGRQMWRNAKIEGILEREWSRISSRYNV